MLSQAADTRTGPSAPARGPTHATAVLLATAAAAGGGPAAALPWEGGTLLGRLLEQLASVGVRDVHVITRVAWAPALEPLVGAGATLHATDGPAADLRAVAGLAGEAGGAFVVAYGDLITQREVLARQLTDPRVPTSVLTTTRTVARPYGFRMRARRGRVLAAASPYHAVRVPNSTFLGVLKVAPADRAQLMAVAERLAALVDGPLPPAWEEELVAKGERWRRWLGVRAIVRAGGEAPPVEERDHLPLPADDEAELARRLAQAPEDVVSLLLVGLVRDGASVGLSRLRGLFWAHPQTDAEVGVARERIEHHDEERALLNSAVKSSDGFFTTFFVSPYSKYIARWAARRGLTPNAVTIASLAVGIVAAAAFATGGRAGLVAGAVLLQAAFTLDCVDGQLARYTRTFSKFGAWLDSMFDRTKEYIVYGGLAIGASRAGAPVWDLAAAALALQTSRHAVDFAFPAVRREKFALTPQPPIEEPLDGPRRGRGEIDAAAEATAPAPEPVPQRASLRRRALVKWRSGDRSRRIVWVKKIVAFPIGERFAAISITAALFSPRTTFIVLLAWGAFAAVYVVAGRALRSLAA